MSFFKSPLARIIALAILPVASVSANNTPHDLSVANFSQTWSNTGQITTNDSWTGVPSIEGFLGDVDAGTGTGVDPQTRLQESSGAIDVIANQANPNTNTAGGVAEFEITDPVVAMQGSGTADAPALVVYLNTTGRTNVTVSYNLRDVDGAADNTNQQFALQYRIGATGTFTNVPAGYVSDASSGPSLATLVTPVSVNLSTASANAVDNQSNLQLRIVTTNAGGSDEWVGVDDIVVTSTAVVTEPGISITGGDTLAEGDAGCAGGSTSFTFDVTASPAPTAGDDITVAYTVAGSGAAPANAADFAGGAFPSGNVVLTNAAPTQVATVQVACDDDVEPTETFTVTLDDPANASLSDATEVGTITTDDIAASTLTISNESVVEGNAGTQVLNFTVTADTANASDITFTIDTVDGTATDADNDYEPIVGGAGTITAGNTTTTVSVTINGDTAVEPNEAFAVRLSNPSANAGFPGGGATTSGTGTITNDDRYTIAQIQGSGLCSPLVTPCNIAANTAGPAVDIAAAVVTAVDTNQFFMQMSPGDGNPLTSDGILVFTGSAPTVVVGDTVLVTGTVREFFGLTEISAPTVTVDNPPVTIEPTPIVFGNATGIPSLDPAALSCGLVGTDQNNFECFEGMLVSVPAGIVAAGNQRFASDPYAEIHVSARDARSLREKGVRFTQSVTVGENDAAGVWDGNPEIFELDADEFGAVATGTGIAGGATFSATGVMSFDFGDYELWPTTFVVDPASTVLPRPMDAPAGASELPIGSFNMLRLCDTAAVAPPDAFECLEPIPTSASLAIKVSRLSDYIVQVMRAPAVIGVQEVENLAVLTMVANELSADTGRTYSAHLSEGNDPGGIDVGYLVDTTRVTSVVVTQLNKAETWNDPQNGIQELHDHPPLQLDGTFVGGPAPVPFTVINNHTKARSCTDRFTTSSSCNDQGDVDRDREKRFRQAVSIATIVQGLQTANPSRPLVLVGDYNAYEFTDGFVDVVGLISGTYDDAENVFDLDGPNIVDPALFNAALALPANLRYSYRFTEDFNAVQGSADRDLPFVHLLDHALLSRAARARLTDMQYGRSNTDAPAIESSAAPSLPAAQQDGYGAGGALGVSDHDAFVVTLESDCASDPSLDTDGDGVCNLVDNCPTIANPSQADSDNNGIGDACEGGNAAPTITDIGPQTGPEDTALMVPFTIGDDGTVRCGSDIVVGNVTASVSPSGNEILETANIGFSGGNGTSCTASLTPFTNAVGTVTVTFTVTDSNGATASDSFTATFTNVNDSPSIQNLPATTSTNEDTATAAIDFAIGDVETASDQLIVTATSSDQSIVANSGIAIGGTGAARTVTITPVANASGGPVTITISVDDGSGQPNSIVTDTIDVTVNGVNDAPTISDVADQSTAEDTATGAIPFTVGDVETAAAALTVTATSSDQAVVTDAGIVIGGSGANRTVTITPVPNASGPTTITLTVNDGTTSSSDTFVLTVGANNDTPTITDVGDQATNEDTATGAIAFTIGDVETAAADLVVTATSSNQSVVANAGLVLGGSGANRTLTITPVANASGSTTITLTVSDGNGGTVVDTFVLTVASVNDAPMLSAIADRTIPEDTTTGAIPFTLLDVDHALDCDDVTVSSSNDAVVPEANIVIGGSGGNCTVTVTPIANATGSTLIELSVADGAGGFAAEAFTLTVDGSASNDLPTITGPANQTIGLDSSTGALTVTIGDVETAAAALTLTGSSSNTNIVPNGNIAFGGSGTNRTVTVTPATGQSGTTTITLTVTDTNGGSATATFTLTVVGDLVFANGFED